jgi:hypothetical protein
VFEAKAGEKVMLQLVSETQRAEFLLFLEFCYSERIIQPVTCLSVRKIRDICFSLGLHMLSSLFDQISSMMRDHLHRRLVKDV